MAVVKIRSNLKPKQETYTTTHMSLFVQNKHRDKHMISTIHSSAKATFSSPAHAIRCSVYTEV